MCCNEKYGYFMSSQFQQLARLDSLKFWDSQISPPKTSEQMDNI